MALLSIRHAAGRTLYLLAFGPDRLHSDCSLLSNSWPRKSCLSSRACRLRGSCLALPV